MSELYRTIGQTLTDVREKHYYFCSDLSTDGQKHSLNTKLYFFIEKQFLFRQSILSEYFRLVDYRTIYNISVAILILLAANLMHADYIEKQDFLDLGTLAWCFSKFELVFLPWFLMCFLSLLVVPLVRMILLYRLPKLVWLPLYSIQIVLMQYIAITTCSVN